MPVIQIERIVSANSEDPAYPAENLLKSDKNNKWKCKAGEKQASVIFQLNQDTIINAIDIGNENSAFVEVLVAKSSSSNDFKVLLVASTLMNLKESKEGVNTNSVRFFKKSDLTEPTANEKWDRVKVVCTQPFNKHVQFGLSFIVLHSLGSAGTDSEASSSLGKFSLKTDDVNDNVAVGSWFAKRKDPPPSIPQGAAAAIRDASSPAALAQLKDKKPPRKRQRTPKDAKNGETKPTIHNLSIDSPKPGPLVKPAIPSLATNTSDEAKPANIKISKNSPKPGPLVKRGFPSSAINISDDEDSPADDTDADETYSPTKDKTSVLPGDDIIPSDSDDDGEEDGSQRPEKRAKRTKKDASSSKQKNSHSSKNQNASSAVSSKRKTQTVTTKPFNRLLEGVTFVISGYVNPTRGDLRSKACAMGARYKSDWDHSCTHLICAFVNTPKFNQVKGKGKIVKKDWVEECHNCRRRLPWRRFAIDWGDEGPSSEEEVWEEGSVPSTSTPNGAVNAVIASGINRRHVSSGSDTEEEIEKVKARQAANKLTPTTQNNFKAKVDETKKTTPKKTSKQKDPFADDTDVDSDSEYATAKLPLPFLPEFFCNITFHIGPDIVDEERKKLNRYITAYKGSLADDMDGSVEYVITNLPDVAAQIGEEFGVSSVSPDWVWECSDQQKLVPVDDYQLL